MKILIVSCMLVISLISVAHGTCVLDSDFGFILNCAFKKSGLFRVRNLGGLKAHFGLGFSVGDELGLAESLGNVEGNKRRALNIRGTPNNIGVLPPPKITVNQPAAIVQKSRPHALTVRPPQTQQRQELSNGKQANLMTNAILMPGTGQLTQVMRPNMFAGQNIQTTYGESLASQSMPQAVYQKQQPLKYPQFGMQPQPVQQQQKYPTQQLMTEAASLPLGVPAFRPLPKKDKVTEQQQKDQTFYSRNPAQNPMFQYAIPNQVTNSTLPYPLRLDAVAQNLVYSGPVSHHENNQAMIKNFGDQTPLAAISSPSAVIPVFQGMPQSASRVSVTGTLLPPEAENVDKITFNEIQSEPKVDLMGHTIEELAAAANVSVDVIKAAIITRQQQVMAQKQVTMATTAPTQPPITKKPPSKYSLAGGSKVMNAPKEYYPVGYDKNFDDNFVSKVDLPGTTFHCGDQKHFPGLYADEDLGCMVFHVCALTDDGLIMKSFLCPESTLFDQTILKCNWWFYVDCKHSKTLYDSNIPVSKSYQLMKALTFFSKYKNQQQSSGTDDGIDIEALKNSVSDNKTKNEVTN